MQPPSPERATTASVVLQPRRLVRVTWAILAADLAAIAVHLAAPDLVTVGLLLVMAVPLLLSLWLLRRGQANRAAALMLATLTLSITALAFKAQGLRDEAIVAIPGLLVFASMFVTRRTFLLTLAAMASALIGITVANVRGWRVNSVDAASFGSLVIVVSILLVTAFFVWLMASDLRTALARLESENERLRASHARIDILAHQDALTGLPNRLVARNRFKQSSASGRGRREPVALLFLDLDNFKTVNDSLGHAAGDLLLCDVAKRLQQLVRPGDTVSRQGGDEFLIVLQAARDVNVVASAAGKIVEQLSAPFFINGLELSMTCSIGIAVFPEHGADFDTLLKNADVALYRAKDAGRNVFRYYDADMHSSVIENQRLAAAMRTALAKAELRLHYQPQFELASGRIVGAEALLRWRHPDLGLVPPAKFIPVAEKSGQINSIGSWVLQEAFRQARQWHDAGLAGLIVAVNLSPVQFRRDDIEREVMDALAEFGVAPASVELELTESLLIAESGHISPLLARLRNLGIRFAIDDFGTGYSNLGYLKRFEVERLKIDQSFIRRLTEDTNDESIVRAIIEMAHGLRLETIAEGIENLPTLRQLIGLGCDFGQGHHWAPALPPEEFFRFVCRHRAATDA